MDSDYDDIEDQMLQEESETRDSEGTIWIKPKKFKLSKHIADKINRFSYSDVQDIAEKAIVEVERRVQQKKHKNFKHSPMVFTGYWQQDTTKIYGLRHKEDTEGNVTIQIKGGKHKLLDFRMNQGDRRKFLLNMAAIAGFKPKRYLYKKNGKTYARSWQIYIGK